MFEKSPLYKYIQNGKLPPGPDHELRAAMFQEAVQSMHEAGWKRLSISHWASNTRERNFYNYYAKTRTDCLAFGPGAGGNLSGYGFMQHRQPDAWAKAVESGVKPVAMMTKPPLFWELGRAVAEQLELNFFNPSQLAHEFSEKFATLWNPLIDNWTEAGLLAPVGNRFELTVPGQFWQGRMTQHILDYFKSQTK